MRGGIFVAVGVGAALVSDRCARVAATLAARPAREVSPVVVLAADAVFAQAGVATAG